MFIEITQKYVQNIYKQTTKIKDWRRQGLIELLLGRSHEFVLNYKENISLC